MKEFWSFVKKEAKHILRDKRTMLILFVMPVVMMLIFGFAVSTDVKTCVRWWLLHRWIISLSRL